jgi:hypothetical protein
MLSKISRHRRSHYRPLTSHESRTFPGISHARTNRGKDLLEGDPVFLAKAKGSEALIIERESYLNK